MSVHAVVLIQCEIDGIPEAAQAIADIPGVSEVYSVAGEYDLVVIIRVSDHDELSRVILTLAYELRDRGLSLGLATLCISGGQGLAVVIERVEEGGP